MDIFAMQQSVKEYFDISLFNHTDDILYQLLQNDTSKIGIVLKDLIWRYETTAMKKTRIDLFLLALRCLYIQDFDIHDEYLFAQCINPNIILPFTKWKWFMSHRSDGKILSKFLNHVGAIQTIFISNCEFDVMSDKDMVKIRKDENEYLKSQSYQRNSLSFLAWLEVTNRSESLQHIAAYTYLFADIKYQWAPIYATLLCFHSKCLNSFCTLYQKGIRYIFSLPSEQQIDPYDGGIPYLIIQQNNSQILKWYIECREKEDKYFRKYKNYICIKYFHLALDMKQENIELLLKPYLAAQRLQTYKESLMRITWHPERVCWWMPNDEYQEIFNSSSRSNTV